jgi:poly(glycerol-phosphate) alpha-glucosyltransferase
MAVLDGWAAGTPALMTGACNLPEGIDAGAALACGDDAGGIAAALEAALALDDAGWLRMAAAAHGLAAGRFAATTVAQQWAAVYAGAIAGCEGGSAR